MLRNEWKLSYVISSFILAMIGKGMIMHVGVYKFNWNFAVISALADCFLIIIGFEQRLGRIK